MFKFLLSVFLLTFSLNAIPKESIVLTPQGCEAVAMELMQVAGMRDEKVKIEDLLEQAKKAPNEQAVEFYTFWVHSIYGILKDVDPQTIGMNFYLQCFAANGQVHKLYGPMI